MLNALSLSLDMQTFANNCCLLPFYFFNNMNFLNILESNQTLLW